MYGHCCLVYFFFSFFISRLTIKNILRLGWIRFHQPLLLHFLLFVFVRFSWNPHMHCEKAFIPNNRKRFKNTENTWHWNVTFLLLFLFHFLLLSITFHFVPEKKIRCNKQWKTAFAFVLLWKQYFDMNKNRREAKPHKFFLKKNIIEIE